MKFNFDVDSALLQELGERLVETEHLAIVELVKNCYDADATEVQVKVIHDNKGRKITITDNGSGMTLEDVRNYWMIIANTNKVNNNISKKYGRVKTGSKGIGRFSCRRLGEELTLYTRAINNKNENEYTELYFDWMKFKPGDMITSVKIEGAHKISNSKETGTKLVIHKNKSIEWFDYQKRYIERNLSYLSINRQNKRKGYDLDPGFNIHYSFDGKSKEIKNLREQFKNAGWGSLTAEVDNYGKAIYQLEALDCGVVKIIKQEHFKNLKNVKLDVGIFPTKKDHMRNPSVISIVDLKENLPSWGGIHVLFNGFRVYPYGEKNDDWLGIDRDRGRSKAQNTDDKQLLNEIQKMHLDDTRYLLALLSSYGYVGEVIINDEKDSFVMKANREGFVESQEFEELKKFIRFGIDWATIYRSAFIQKKFERLFNETFKNVKDKKVYQNTDSIILNTIENIEEQILQTVPEKEKKYISKIFQKNKKFTNEFEKQLNTELDHLRIIASSSILLLIFAHEIKAFLGQFDNTLESLKNIANDLERKNSNIVLEIYNNLYSFRNRFHSLLNMVSAVSIKDKVLNKGKYTLVDRIKTSFSCFQLICDEYNIILDVSGVDNSVQIGPIYEAEVFSLLLNILSNSIKAVIGSNNKEKRIKFSAKKKNKKTCITINDTGVGVDPKNYDKVFERFVSDPEDTLYNELEKRINPKDKYILGAGSGIGLNIVKEIVLKYNGEISFVQPTDNWSSELYIII